MDEEENMKEEEEEGRSSYTLEENMRGTCVAVCVVDVCL